jgi:hypothetical protein
VSLFPPGFNWAFFIIFKNVYHHILSPSSVVFVECGRRPTDPASSACSSRAETAAASQHTGGQASEGPGEDLRPELGTALGTTVSAWQCHSAGTGSSSPVRGGGSEQPYGAVQKDCSPPELLAHMTHSC